MIHRHITASTPLPFTIIRDLWTENPDTLEDIRLEGVHITIESGSWEPGAVAECGFEGDWCVHLSDDPRFADLPEEAKELACDAASNCVEDLAYRLSRGEVVAMVSNQSFSA